MSATENTRLPVADRAALFHDLWTLLREDRRRVLVLLLLACLTSAVALAGPYLLGVVVDRLESGTATVDAVDRIALLVLVAALAQLVLTRFTQLCAARFGERALGRVREDFVRDALALPTPTVEHAGAGDLTTRASSDVGTVGTTLRGALPDVLPALLQVVFLLGGVFWLSPLLGILALTALPPLVLVVRWYLRRSHPAYLEEGRATSSSVAEVTATAEGGRTVEAFGLAGRRIERTDAEASDLHSARLHTLRLRTVFYLTSDAAFAVAGVLVLLVGGLAFLQGWTSLGVVVTCALYMTQLDNPVGRLTFWTEQVQRGAASFARLRGVAGTVEPAGPAPADPADDRIEVCGARFSYLRGREVLRGVDLALRPGERLAVMGPSGAGKTTLGLLLSGIERPTSGTVRVGGVPIADLTPEQLRERVVMVSQEQHVFADSVRDNLAIATAGADDDTVLLAALSAVGADWVQSLPDGLDTAVGTGGLDLDPARAQQLALARVVLADPHMVVLDEATSSLDPSTARRTERALAGALAGRTVVAIAHRLHTAHDADRVAVVEDGRVTELGAHDELLATDGPYAALWSSWHGPEPHSRAHEDR